MGDPKFMENKNTQPKKVRVRPETVRQWKDRMEVEDRMFRNWATDALHRVRKNCGFAIINSDNKQVREFAEIILRLVTRPEKTESVRPGDQAGIDLAR
jgi:hypothetical protein